MKPRRILLVWLALLALLALTAASAWWPMGSWNSVTNLGIAALKAALVAWCYMGLGRARAAPRVAAAVALAALALLLTLSGADYATRVLWQAPWRAPPDRPPGITSTAGTTAPTLAARWRAPSPARRDRL